jgi:exopolysaccharide biosynthesis polyprenyl glycosylphosphotransferase
VAAGSPLQEHKHVAPRRLPRWRGPLVVADGAGPLAPRTAARETLTLPQARRNDLRERRSRIALAVADVSAAFVGLTLALAVLGDDVPSLLLVGALPLILVVSKVQGLYDRDDLLLRKSTLDEVPQLFQLATLYTLVIWLASGPLVVGSLTAHQVMGLWGALFVSSVAGRMLARTVSTRRSDPERCVFIGDAGAHNRLAAKLEPLKVDLVGRLSLQRVARRGARTASTEELRDLFSFTSADRVIIEPHTLPPEEMHDFIRAAKASGVRVSLLPRALDVVGSSVVLDEIEGMTLLGVRRFGLPPSSRLVKRSFDLLGSCVALVVTAPLMLAIAVAVKLDSPGPVLFRQERVGRDGRRFRICKFRTMCADAEERKAELRARNEAQGLFKIAEDPRITRVGRFLRRTSLDELPQLFNVVTGDMSLVGPRPLVLDEDEQITGYDRRRLALTPGMTGHWQILGSTRVPLHEMVKIDYLYVASWSLWNDVKLLLRTIPHILGRRGL